MADDEYDIIAPKTVSELRRQLDEMKKTNVPDMRALQKSIQDLTAAINTMIAIFKEASEGMKVEEQEEHVVAKKIDPLISKFEDISYQNQKIAEGILALADIIKEKGTEERKPMPQSYPSPQQPPSFGMAEFSQGEEYPSFPPPPEKKKGLFRR